MKKNTLKTLKQMTDGQQFKLSKRSSGVVYEMVRKWKEKGTGKHKATITAPISKRSYVKDQSTVVYPV